MGDMDQAGGSEIFPIFQLLAITRWIQFASISVMFGAALFWNCIDSVAPRARGATARLLRIAALTAAISGVFWLAEIVVNMTGSASNVFDPATLRLFFETPFGAVAMLRLILFAAAVLIAVLPWPNRVLFPLNLLVGALLLISQAWLGHAAEGGGGPFGVMMILVYCVHVLAAAAWVGSLPPLVFALRDLRGLKSAGERTYETLSRYSIMAMVAVGLIIVSGAVNAGFRSEFSPGRLLDSEYGLVLLVKAAGVSAMLGLACFNRFVVTPRLRASAGDAQAARLRISVSLELALGVLVLGAAALLGITPPPG